MSRIVVSTRVDASEKIELEDKANEAGYSSVSAYLKSIIDSTLSGDSVSSKGYYDKAKEALISLEEKENEINALKSRLAKYTTHPIKEDLANGLQLTINGKKHKFKSIPSLLDRLKKKL